MFFLSRKHIIIDVKIKTGEKNPQVSQLAYKCQERKKLVTLSLSDVIRGTNIISFLCTMYYTVLCY